MKPTEEELAAMRRMLDQMQGKAKREYPEGRIGPHDEGALALAVGTSPEHKTVIVQFGTPVTWFGMGPEQAVEFAGKLIKAAREVSDKPVTINF